MSPRSSNHPTAARIAAVLKELEIAYREFSIGNLPGDYSNFTHLVKVETEGAAPRKIVVRRYNPANTDEGHDKPRCEYQALKLLHRCIVR